MRLISFTAATVVSMMSIGLAFAQVPVTPSVPPTPAAPSTAAPPPQTPSVPAASPAVGTEKEQAANPAPTVNIKRECKNRARQKGLRRGDAAGEVAVCMAQVQLDCTKKAAAQHLAKRNLRVFVRQCLGMKPRSRRAK